jgi:hypothetical protein
MESTPTDYLTRLAPLAVHQCGTVLATDDTGYIVGGEWGRLEARRSASCQLMPELGDLVLISGSQPDQVFLIAVLERRGPAPLRTQLGEGMALSVEAAGTLTISATRALNLKADDVGVIGRRAHLLVSKFKASTREAVLSLQSARLIGDVVETSLGRLSQLLGSSQRTVQGLDQTRSGDIDYRAEQTVSMHGQHLFANADKLVRIDGEQVHIG